MKTALIMGTDEHACALYGALSGMKVPVFMFNSFDDLGLKCRVQDNGITHWSVKIDDAVRSHIGCLFWRSYDGVDGSDAFDKNNNRGLLESWLKGFERAGQSVNSFSAWQNHQTKAWQMAEIADLLHESEYADKWTIPESIYGRTKPDAAKEMQFIVKPAQGGEYARFVSIAMHWDHKCPACWQPKIEGEHLRLYMVGDRMFAYNLHFTGVDYRQGRCRVVEQAITTELHNAAGLIFADQDYQWGAMDVVYDGKRHYVLDVNVSPMWLGFEKNGEITLALAEMIKEKCKDDQHS